MASREPNKVSKSVGKHKLPGCCVDVGIEKPQQLCQPSWGLDTHIDTNTQEFISGPQKTSSCNAPCGHCTTFRPPFVAGAVSTK